MSERIDDSSAITYSVIFIASYVAQRIGFGFQATIGTVTVSRGAPSWSVGGGDLVVGIVRYRCHATERIDGPDAAAQSSYSARVLRPSGSIPSTSRSPEYR